jgi:hypothetical protein
VNRDEPATRQPDSRNDDSLPVGRLPEELDVEPVLLDGWFGTFGPEVVIRTM